MIFTEVDLKLKQFTPLLSVMTGHSQTILGHIVPSEYYEMPFVEEILKLSDGDEMLLEFLDNNSNTTLSLYHGLAGDSQADYIRRSARLGYQLGWNIVLVNHRGASPKAQSKKTYHSGRGSDASEVLLWSKNKFRNTKQVAVGFSMSGSILLNLLTQRYGTEQPDYAVVVNAPLNLAKAAEYLTRGVSRIYDFRFYSILKDLIQKRTDIKMPLLARTIDVDELYTSKINGFKNAADYYEQCSVFNYVDRIRTKTFVLSAYDDPFIDVKDYLGANWSSDVHLTLQTYGGHMGYFSKIKDPKYGHRWLDHYLGSVFEKIEELKII